MNNLGFVRDEFQNNDNDDYNRSEIIELKEASQVYLLYRNISNFFEPFSLWYFSLKSIEKNCGCGVLAYFRFLSWLFKINMLMLILQLSILVVPFLVYKSANFNDLIADKYRQNEFNMFGVAVNCTQKASQIPNPISVELILDIFQGQGPLENSPMFLGYYFNVSYFNISSNEFIKKVFNTPAAYSITFWLCIIASFILTLYSSGKNYRCHIIDDSIFNDKFGFCIFTGYDHRVTKRKRISNMKSDLTRKLKIQFQQTKENIARLELSNNQLFFIYLTRIIVNLLFVGFLLLIYYIIVLAQDVPMQLSKYAFVNDNKILSMLKDYVPSVTIALINVVFQIINIKVVTLEKYSATVAVGVCLKRVILVQATSLLLFMVTLLNLVKQSNTTDDICHQTDAIKCWETYVGQQFYRLSIIGFISLVIIGPLFQLIKSLIYNKFHERARLVDFMGTSEFDLSKEGFLLISSQCVCWMGLWFCPFLPVIMLLELFLLFYIRKSMFTRNLFQTTMETSSVAGSQRFFLEMLLYSLAFVMLPVGYLLSNKTPSRGCSPFRIYEIDDKTYSFSFFLVDFIESLSHGMKVFWNGLTSKNTILSILGILIIITYVKYAQAKAYSKYISALRKEIIKEENNQLFYKRQIMNANEIVKKNAMLSPIY